MKTFNVAINFSRTPSARTEHEGQHPGEQLRKLLIPLLKDAIEHSEKLQINLDGTFGYGTSFLEETFGGLIREEGFSLEQLKSTLDFVSEEEPDLIDEIWSDINDAAKNEK